MTARCGRIFLAALSLNLTCATLGRGALTVQWGHQLVTPTKDAIFGSMVADSNDAIYMAISREPLEGAEAAPKAYHLLKFDQQGKALWDRRLGKNDAGGPLHMAVSGLATDDRENIYAFGYTHASLGRENIGKNDMFVAKYDQDGIRQWVRQIGTPEHDVCAGLDIDASGNLYIAGYSYGAFAKPNKGGADMVIAAYSQAGTLLWRDQFGTEVDERAMSLRLGEGNDIYLCGITSGALAGQNQGHEDFVVARYSRTGESLWLRQYGTDGDDRAVCMEIGEQGQVYVGGRTLGGLQSRRSHRGYGDAFLARIAETGDVLWTRQFGSRGWDKTFHLARFQDGSGDVLAGGCQYPDGRFCQAFSHRYSSKGKLIWTKTFGKRRPKAGTCGRAVAIDRDNHCYLAGGTSADNWAVSNGTNNVFIVRFDETSNSTPQPNP